jgi:hypothetical protein
MRASGIQQKPLDASHATSTAVSAVGGKVGCRQQRREVLAECVPDPGQDRSPADRPILGGKVPIDPPLQEPQDRPNESSSCSRSAMPTCFHLTLRLERALRTGPRTGPGVVPEMPTPRGTYVPHLLLGSGIKVLRGISGKQASKSCIQAARPPAEDLPLAAA